MDNYNNEMQLKDILSKLLEYKHVIFQKKGKIILISFFCFVLGLLFAFSSIPYYKAELTFIVEDNQGVGGNLGAMSGIASQFGFDMGSSTTFSEQNILELIKSRSVVNSALMQNAKILGNNNLLIEHYITINELRKDWEYEKFSDINFNTTLTYLHDSISGEIWRLIIENELSLVMQYDEANIINLSYTSLNEEFAKEFAESLIDEMSKMYIVHRTKQANNTLNFLQERADSVFAELEIAEEEFAKIKDINQRIIKASGRLKELQLMREVEVLNTMYLEIVKNLELSKITLLDQTPIINIIDTPILPLENDKMPIMLAGIFGGFLGAFFSISFFISGKLFRDALEM